MFWTTLMFLGPLVALGILASYRSRFVTVAMVLAAIGVWFFAASDNLGRPKEQWMEWKYRHVEEATVLKAELREGLGIFLWVYVGGEPTPLSYMLPWDQNMAEQIQKAQKEAEANGTPMMVKLPFERSYDQKEARFYALPQPMLPQKPPGQVPMQVPRIEA